MVIKASEARSMAKEVEAHRNSVCPQLLQVVGNRILDAASSGKFETTLNSLDDDGSLVKSPGFFLSYNVTRSIEYLLKLEGYRIETPSENNIKVTW